MKETGQRLLQLSDDSHFIARLEEDLETEPFLRSSPRFVHVPKRGTGID